MATLEPPSIDRYSATTEALKDDIKFFTTFIDMVEDGIVKAVFESVVVVLTLVMVAMVDFFV